MFSRLMGKIGLQADAGSDSGGGMDLSRDPYPLPECSEQCPSTIMTPAHLFVFYKPLMLCSGGTYADQGV